MGAGLYLWDFWVVFFFLAILRSGGAEAEDCATTTCSTDGPEIRFPFRRRVQPPHCGYRGFELSCKGSKTVVDLPFSGQFPVTSISYSSQKVHLEPGSCPPATFFNLNLSSSPFVGPDSHLDYMLLNCTAEVPTTSVSSYGSEVSIRCLDGFGRHFFAVRNSDINNLNETCISMRTAPVSEAFVKGLCSGDVYDPSLGWETPDCRNCENGGGICNSRNMTSQEVTCIPKARRNSGRWGMGSIIGVSIGAFLFVLVSAIVIGLYLSWKRRKEKEIENQSKIEKFLEDYKSLNPMRYSYADIKRITNQFKTKLGEGGYGIVYKGSLPSGVQVAVKMLTSTISNNGEDFVNEVRTIGRIHHVNVVRLLGFCADGSKRALLYEYMPNESLAKFIFPEDHVGPLLGWTKLHEIAVGIARGIEYLHQGCDQRIIHFDIKPHNILLDQNLSPKISDFGLAKLCSKEQSVVSMTVARGTAGYIAPEVASRNVGSVSYKSDVYSFGMLLLEMVGGRKNVDASAENASQIYFPEWIYKRMGQGLELALKAIEEEEDAKVARIMTTTALWCIQWYPVNRPSMKRVVQMLQGSAESLAMPPNPFVSSVASELDSNPEIHSMSLAPISESEAEETSGVAVPR